MVEVDISVWIRGLELLQFAVCIFDDNPRHLYREAGVIQAGIFIIKETLFRL